jgi:hypothetical protein
MIRRSKPKGGRDLARLRSALSSAVTPVRDAALAVEEKVVWPWVDLLRGASDLVKWPFERIVWAVERGLVWPLERRFGSWDGLARTGGIAALLLLATGAGVLGFVWAAGSGGGKTTVTQAQLAAPAAAPVTIEAPPENPAQQTPVLHGATPNFSPQDSVGAAHAVGNDPSDAKTAALPSVPAAEEAETAATASSVENPEATTKVVAVGPAATKVAHRFAGAFVHFETGQVDTGVRTAFAATATPQLTRSLLRRPPRLPANVKVPRAKVLNVVPGPKHGDVYTMSIALLRVGVTSELRIEMERDPRSGEWEVTDVLG